MIWFEYYLAVCLRSSFQRLQDDPSVGVTYNGVDENTYTGMEKHMHALRADPTFDTEGSRKVFNNQCDIILSIFLPRAKTPVGGKLFFHFSENGRENNICTCMKKCFLYIPHSLW